MTAIAGAIGVTGIIAPKDDADKYAVTDPRYGIDGLRNVVDYAERDSIPDLRRKQGMIVGVQFDNTWWELKAAPWTGTASDWKIPTFSGGSPSNLGTKWTIELADNFTVPPFFQYLIYGKLDVFGVMSVSMNAKLTVMDGIVDMKPGGILNVGPGALVELV